MALPSGFKRRFRSKKVRSLKKSLYGLKFNHLELGLTNLVSP